MALIHTIRRYQVIGSGARYARPFIDNAWQPEMTMEQVAELGYFIIRYVESFRLDLSVGINNENPQVWYIPNRYRENTQHEIINDDIMASNEQLYEMRIRVDKRLRKHVKHVKTFLRI
jgi:20S proteasome alpha/beta subunit